MRFEDYFKIEFTREPDCIIGCEFKSISYKVPHQTNEKVKIKSGAHCAIAKECNPSIASTKINELKSKSFTPHLSMGDYLKATEIDVYYSKIDNLIREPNPLAISKKKSTIHRVQLADICSKKKYSLGFIVFMAGFSQVVSLDRSAKLDALSKLE